MASFASHCQGFCRSNWECELCYHNDAGCFDASWVSINKVLLISQYTFNEAAILPKALIVYLMHIKDCKNGGREHMDETN